LAVNVLEHTFNNNTNVTDPLLHELQLGEQLNDCVHQSRRADFSLMLAMLCDDVREQSQFVLPQASAIDGTATDVKEQTTNTLRTYFDLPLEAPLALEHIEQIHQYNQASLIVDNDLPNLHLSNAIAPKPLAFRNDNKHINSNVIGNTSLVCQAKYAKNQLDECINKPLDMKVDSWLKAVQTSIVKTSLLNVAA